MVFEFMPLSIAPGRIRTCAHGSGGQCCMTLLPGKMRRSRPVGERMGSATVAAVGSGHLIPLRLGVGELYGEANQRTSAGSLAGGWRFL